MEADFSPPCGVNEFPYAPGWWNCPKEVGGPFRPSAFSSFTEVYRRQSLWIVVVSPAESFRLLADWRMNFLFFLVFVDNHPFSPDVPNHGN